MSTMEGAYLLVIRLFFLITVVSHISYACTGIGPIIPGTGRGPGLGGLLKGSISTEPFDGGATGDNIEEDTDLECFDFGQGCRWRNGEDGIEDDLEWDKGTGQPDLTELEKYTGTRTPPSSNFIFVFPDEARPASDRAFLVGDPILCQNGDGTLSFKYWLSENAQLRVCKRNLGDIEPSDCSETIRGKAGPGPRQVTIESQEEPFEVVLEANNFLTRDDFVLVDELRYDADICEPVPPIDDRDACKILHCDFQSGTECADAVQNSNGWRLGRNREGNPSTGIPGDPVRSGGQYAYLKGRNPRDMQGAEIKLPKFKLATTKQFNIQYYKASFGSDIAVMMDGDVMFINDKTTNTDRRWVTESFEIPKGEHEIRIMGRGLQKFQYMAVDDMRLTEPGGATFC